MHVKVARDSASAKGSLGNEKREPGLLPSIPILSPILDPVLDPILNPDTGDTGIPVTTKTPSTTKATTAAATPAPTTKATTPASPAPTTTGGAGGGGEAGGGGGGDVGTSSPEAPGGGAAGGDTTSPAGGAATGSAGSGSGSAPTGTSPAGGNSGASNGNDDDDETADRTAVPGKTLLANGAHNQQPSTVRFVSTIFSDGKPIGTHTGTTVIQPESTNVDGGNGGGGEGGPVDEGAEASGKGGLPTGAIAGIAVVAIFLLIGLLVILLRKRFQNRRSERRNQWWNGQRGDQWSDAPESNAATGTMSNRSSFATTFDHSRDGMHYAAPPVPVPPMVEIRDTHIPAHTLHSPAAAESPFLISFDGPDPSGRPASMRSFDSGTGSSDSHAQYLHVSSTNVGDQAAYSPMSVRPFSPDESYEFPKPPDRRSRSTFSHNTVVEDPFSDPSSVPGLPPTQSPTETVRRRFSPTLHDEIRVTPGETVRVTKIFDDGWALVDKDPSSGQGKVVQGLIPVDSIRDTTTTT